jgi:arabinose-5-phosphate isomerase
VGAAERLIPLSQFERLRAGREVVRKEADALLEVMKHLDASFCQAVDSLLNSTGSVIVCGMGKAGLIGQKLAATFSSTGTRAHFLHPGEAVHGDLGCLHAGDVLLALSNSGETEELLSILPTVKSLGVSIVSITSTDQNSLARQSDVVIPIGRLKEACPWGLAPTTSTTAMLAVGDALALVVSQERGFSPQQFARFHPAGSLGQKLRRVTEVMRPLEQLRTAAVDATVRQVFTQTTRPGRRSGAVILLNDDGTLAGIFTDSDLARLMERRNDAALDQPIGDVMTSKPLTVHCSAMLSEVIDLLAERKISELPVVDDDYRPRGMIDITDVIGWIPAESHD